MTDPTKVRTLNEDYPLCAKYLMLINYRIDTGAYITAEQVERVLRALIVFGAIPTETTDAKY